MSVVAPSAEDPSDSGVLWGLQREREMGKWEFGKLALALPLEQSVFTVVGCLSVTEVV